MSPTYRHVTKLFLESEIQYKEYKQTKILCRKGQNKIWAKLSSLGQEPTFKVSSIRTDRSVKTVYVKIRLLLKEADWQGPTLFATHAASF